MIVSATPMGGVSVPGIAPGHNGSTLDTTAVNYKQKLTGCIIVDVLFLLITVPLDKDLLGPTPVYVIGFLVPLPTTFTGVTIKWYVLQ